MCKELIPDTKLVERATWSTCGIALNILLELSSLSYFASSLH